MGTTQGMPWMDTRAPLLALQISTSTTPKPATTTIFSTVMLTGGATRPLVRRRVSRNHVSEAYPPTATTRRIQPARTVRLPLARSLITESLMGRVPP